MNIICEKDILYSAVTPALSAASNKNTIVALECLLINAIKETGELIICGYDLEKGVRVTISGDGVEIIDEGTIIINAAKFASIIKNLPDGEDVHISTDEDLLMNIKSGKSDFTLHGLNSDQFPQLPTLKGENDRILKLPRKILKNMINTTHFSISVNNSRPALNGAFFEIKNNQINVVSCDMNRISIRRNFEGISNINSANDTENADLDLDVNFIVPGKSLGELLKLIGDEEETCDIELTSKHVIISFDNIIFFSRLIDGEFLDYRRNTKIDAKTNVIVNTHEFLECVERAALLTEDKQKTSIKLSFIKKEIDLNSGENDGILRISSVSQLGQVCDECDIILFGEELEIGFNYKYLAEALRAVKDEKILLKLESPTKSLLILPYNEINNQEGENNEGNSNGEENSENNNDNGNNINNIDNILEALNINVETSEFLYLAMPVRMRE